MLILAIETSCDETALALVEAKGGSMTPRLKVIENIVSSQTAFHAPFGGVVPNIAKREHLKNLPLIFNTLYPKPYSLSPDVIAVTVGPGLEPALWAGINFAKEIHKKYFPKAKLVGVNHMEGHLYSFLLPQKTANSKCQITNAKTYPAVGLVVSGGHTILLLLKSLTEWKKLGETRDDAAGEAFDKVARMLGLPYPGGPEIERAAAKGDPGFVNFPRPMIHDKNYDFSFSGLKTSVLYYLRDAKLRMHANDSNGSQNSHKFTLSSHRISDIAASFQKAAVDVLVAKTMRAAKEYKANSVILAGGVAANQLLRTTLRAATERTEIDLHGRIRIAAARGRRRAIRMHFFAPPMAYNTDNAAMIAAAAYIQTLKKKNRRITAQANLTL